MISACILHKNDNLNLVRAVRSVQSVADQILVIDTGSIDTNFSHLEELGVEIISFNEKFDFASAKNFALRQAKYEWIFFLDSDEVLGEHQENKIISLTKMGPNNAYCFTINNYFPNGLWASFPVTRLLCKSIPVYYEKPIHETANYSLSKMGIIPQIPGIIVHHYGYLISKEKLLKKQHYYINMLKDLIVHEPLDAASHWHLANSYASIGEYELAYLSVKKAIDIDPTNKIPYIFLARYNIANKKYVDAISILEEIMQIKTQPYWTPTIANLLGMAYLKIGKVELAREHFMKVIDEQPWSVHAIINLSVCEEKLGNMSKAMRWLERGILLNPHLLSVERKFDVDNPFAFQEDVTDEYTGISL